MDVAAPLITNEQGGHRSTDIDGATFVVEPVNALTSSRDGMRLDSQEAEGGHLIAAAGRVRRLTPRECERLQGFPDDWTKVPGQRCPDSRRYGALGNAVTVNVGEWLGRRLMAIEEDNASLR